jgi:hypothetical protein
MSFEKELSINSLGVMASSIMTECETHGMTWGCTINCPVLQVGKCELQESDNKELYQTFKQQEQ